MDVRFIDTGGVSATYSPNVLMFVFMVLHLDIVCLNVGFQCSRYSYEILKVFGK